jgi:hypothetical protein
MIKIKFEQEKFVLKFYFATIISVRSTLIRKGAGSAFESVLMTNGSERTFLECGGSGRPQLSGSIGYGTLVNIMHRTAVITS